MVPSIADDNSTTYQLTRPEEKGTKVGIFRPCCLKPSVSKVRKRKLIYVLTSCSLPSRYSRMCVLFAPECDMFCPIVFYFFSFPPRLTACKSPKKKKKKKPRRKKVTLGTNTKHKATFSCPLVFCSPCDM